MKFIQALAFLFFGVLLLSIIQGQVILDLTGCKNDKECRKAINTQFFLNTREDRSSKINILISSHDLLDLTSTSFDVTQPTKFIVHGFLDTGDTKWLLDMTDALLEYGDYNVIRVDWRGGSRTTYNVATANAKLVGLDISDFINTLITQLNLDPANVHCIGHSLGSHVCGYVGNGVPGMGRITGLDPKGSHFTASIPFQSLDPTDAVFVDVIHTYIENEVKKGSGRTLGPVGHVEFFPNSGKSQPGCSVVDNMKNIFRQDIAKLARNFVYCSHLRSIDYFIESLLNPKCQWVAFECEDYASFVAGKCHSCGDDNSKCALLGIRAENYVDKSRIGAGFYMMTNAEKPYCAHHFLVRISTAFPIDPETISSGKVNLLIVGNSGQFKKEIQISNTEHGSSKTVLLTSHINVGPIKRVDVEWFSGNCRLNPFCKNYIYIQGIKVMPMSHYPESMRLGFEATACKEINGSPTPVRHRAIETFPVIKDCQLN